MNSIFVVHFGLAGFLAGLIWVIQILHYPAFLAIRENDFRKFHADHSRRISFIVGPIMVAELVTAGLLAVQSRQLFFVANFGLVVLTWLCTFLVSVPIHNSLALAQVESQDLRGGIQKLIRTNWPRTILWTIRWVALSVWFASNLEFNPTPFFSQQ